MSPRRRQLIVVVCLLAAAAVVVVAARVVRGADRTPVAQNRPGPVLLVAGYGGNTASLELLAVFLRARGRTVEVVPPVADGTGDLREQARNLAAAADRSLAAGAPSVDVVGYSAGGVVARIWVSELGGARVARRIVTLGSPHHGAQAAALGAAFTPGSCPVACRQLVPDSDLLASLPPLPAGIRWVSLWSRDDQTVTPPASARLDGAVNVELQSVCPAVDVSHGRLPTDPLVQGLVAQALGPVGLLTVPSPAQCRPLQQRSGG